MNFHSSVQCAQLKKKQKQKNKVVAKAKLHFLLDECKGDHPDEAEEDPAAGQGRRGGDQARRVVGAAVHGVPAGVVGVQHRRAGPPAHAPCCPPRAVTGGHAARHPWGGGARRSRAVTSAETAQVDGIRTCHAMPRHAMPLWVLIVLVAERKLTELSLTLVTVSGTCKFLNLQ